MKRHQLDPFSLVSGVFVTAIALVGLFGPWPADVGPWAWPTVLMLSGVAVLALVLLRGRRDETSASDDHEGLGHDDDPAADGAAVLADARTELDTDVPAPDAT